MQSVYSTAPAEWDENSKEINILNVILKESIETFEFGVNIDNILSVLLLRKYCYDVPFLLSYQNSTLTQHGNMNNIKIN